MSTGTRRGWDQVAVWTLATAICGLLFTMVGSVVLTAVGIDTWVKLLNAVEVLALLVGIYAAGCVFVWLTRPTPAIVRRRDERGASDGPIAFLIIGAFLVCYGVLSLIVGRA